LPCSRPPTIRRLPRSFASWLARSKIYCSHWACTPCARCGKNLPARAIAEKVGRFHCAPLTIPTSCDAWRCSPPEFIFPASASPAATVNRLLSQAVSPEMRLLSPPVADRGPLPMARERSWSVAAPASATISFKARLLELASPPSGRLADRRKVLCAKTRPSSRTQEQPFPPSSATSSAFTLPALC